MTRRRRSRRLHAVHEHQLTLALDWSADDIARRRHLVVLPGVDPEPQPVAPALRKAA